MVRKTLCAFALVLLAGCGDTGAGMRMANSGMFVLMASSTL